MNLAQKTSQASESAWASPCKFTIGDKDDYFSDEKFKLSDKANVPYSQQEVVQQGVFGSLHRENNITAVLCWNAFSLRHANGCYQGLKRNGACWSNDKIKFCAMAL